MQVKDISLSVFSWLHSYDTVAYALQLMQEEQQFQLPLLEEGQYVGMLHEKDLLDVEDDQALLQRYVGVLPRPMVKSDDHFLQAVQLSAEQNWSLIPVINEEQELMGVLTYRELLLELSRFLGLQDPGGLIVLEKESHQFSFHDVSKLVETNDAQLTQLNTIQDPQQGITIITLRVNKPEISDIIATFQRYDYKVCFVSGEEQYTNELRSNYDHLMHYLKI